MKYSGQGVYYYKNTSLFMAILEWSLSAGWQDTDIKRYEINPVVKTFCKDMNHQSLPLFRQMVNQSKDARILMTISASSIGCVYTPEIRAVSKCGVYGPWTGFRVDLTNCSAITGYQCKPKQFDPPGNAENVSLAVSPMQPPSPFAVDLHILWEPPSDLGSMGKIDKYMIRSGKAKQLMFPLPAIFTETPMIRNVSQDIREMIFQLQTEQSPFTYGVQVIPYAPGQYISENEMGMLPMQTIHVGHNDSMAPFKKQGTILYDSNDTVIVYMNKTMPLQFMFNTQTRSRNSSIDRLALEWGPLVGPNRLDVENRTIVPMNQSELRVYLTNSGKEYGLKMKYLRYNEDEPSDTDWETVSVMSFKMPEVKDEEVKQEKIIQEKINLVPLYVLVPTVTVIVLVIVCLRLGVRRQHFKNLEQRLAEIDEEVDENGDIDHYYIMRAQEDGTEGLVPTVVPDAWELPHTCLKIGRTLGSGAFGQVVRGRISRSLLAHRGIDLHGTEGKSGLFVTVAVKMLQEYTEDRYRQDFLNEIKMMKDIGYHRNIVSILGCCTLREPYCLIVEHVPCGDLLTYLRKIRYKLQEREDEIGNYVNQEVGLFSPLDLLSVARQITLGMEYLSQKGFVHRDLAARNILVGKNKMVKIGDFGLARYIYDDVGKVYVNRRGGKLPLKWMSVEAIFDLTFSSASDVWAFGVLLFEIVTLGGSPYPLVSNADLLQELRNGYRMERPENCSEEIYEIMFWCWQTKPSDRPTFTQLQEGFTAMLQRDSGQAYFSFDINEEREYYKINSDEMDENLAVIEADQEACNKRNVETIADVSKETSSKTRICIESSVANSKEIRAEAEDGLYDAEHKKTNALIDDTIMTETDDSKTCEANELFRGRLTYTAGDVDRVSINSESSVALASSRRAVSELDRLSGSSDEVFMDCSGCLNLSGSRGSLRTCPECQKTRIALTMFDLHGVDRNDSAISSATSDELKSDDGESSKISVSSSEDCTLPIYDSRQRSVTGIKVSVKKTLSTKYYDETSIAELIKKYPAWTERGAIIDRESRAYETVLSDLVDEKLVHMTGNTDIGSAILEHDPEYYSRHRHFSDPYFNYQLAIGKEADWSIVETRM